MEKTSKGAARHIAAFLAECNPRARLADGFEAALVGVGQRFNHYVAVYDYALCTQVLVEQGMDVEQAIEYLEFNVVGAWVGAGTPVFLHRMLARDLMEG